MPIWETDYTQTYHNTPYPAISPTRPELSAAGKTVVISGGGRGIGTAFIAAFAAAGAAHIVALGRNAANLDAVAAKTQAAHPGTRVTAVSGDVTRGAGVARAFAKAREAAPGGKVDVVVANAGYLAEVTPVAAAKADRGEGDGGDGGGGGDDDDDDEVTVDWWRGFEVNVKGVYLQARQFLASAAPGAAFINISATAGHINPALPGFSSYASAKLGAARVVETLQVENPGFRFYNVQPGVLKSDMLTKAKLEQYNLPVDEPELPAHFLVWLASPEAEFLKGKFVWANWDVDELKARKEEISGFNKLVTGLVGWA